MSKSKVCRVLEVSRSSIYKESERRKGGMRKKEGDQIILEKVKEVLKKRPTYGYRRITGMLNVKRREKGLPLWNKKRIYRIMKVNGLLQANPKSDYRPSNHKKTGKIITLHSNTRWCSDCFEIHCFNDERVYVGFVKDCADRECISYVAKNRPLFKEDIQGMMVECVEKRFKGDRTPRPIQFLSDRGSIYTSPETVGIARELGLESCFTRAYSPQSNGMAESFVWTLKRDYVHISDCKDAETTLKLLPEWIHDYNHEAPHSGLGMKTPAEYIKSTLGVSTF